MASSTLFQILYVSQLTPGSRFGVVSEIVTAARHANRAKGVSGALLFDGEYFGQLLEGAEANVVALMKRIETDPRHRAITPLFDGPSEAPRHARAWRSGYCDAQQLGVFMVDDTLRGPAALAAFLAILQGADLA